MSLLEEVYAGRGDIAIIETIEITDGIHAPIYLCDGYEDLQLYVPELSGYREFVASAISAEEPKRDNRGNQSLTIVIDNVLSDAQKRIIEAYEARAITTVKLRIYLANDLSQPASNTLTATVKSVQIVGGQVQITAGFFDIIGRNFNRLTYNSETSPALMYE